MRVAELRVDQSKSGGGVYCVTRLPDSSGWGGREEGKEEGGTHGSAVSQAARTKFHKPAG